MRKFLILSMLAVFISACAKQPAGIGVVPLEGVQVQGKVLDASSPSGVLIKTGEERTALLPGDWEYRQGDQVMDPALLEPGTPIQAIAPSGTSKLVAASDETVVLQSHDDYFSVPLEALPPRSQQIPVRVETYGGQGQVLPLRDAMYGPEYTVLSHPDYSSHNFAVADPYSLSKAYVVGGYQNQPLVLAPGPDRVQAMFLPPAYPRNQLISNQPVRFNYLHDNIQVSTWTSLGDGQIDLGKVLLAGTLLQALPGQAIIEVGQQSPIAVPWEYVTYRNQSLRGRYIQAGSPVGVQYFPGSYDFVSYNDHNVTLLYNQQFVQLPVRYLPGYVYDRRFDFKLRNGKKEKLRFRDAQRRVASGQGYFIPHQRVRKKVKDWDKLRTVYQRPVAGRPGYHLVGDYQKGYARVERAPRSKTPVVASHRPAVFGANQVSYYPYEKQSKKARHSKSKNSKRDKRGQDKFVTSQQWGKGRELRGNERPKHKQVQQRPAKGVDRAHYAQAQKRPKQQAVRQERRANQKQAQQSPPRQKVQQNRKQAQAQAPKRSQVQQRQNKRQAQAPQRPHQQQIRHDKSRQNRKQAQAQAPKRQQVQSRPQAQAQPQRRQAQRQEKSRQAQAPQRPRQQQVRHDQSRQNRKQAQAPKRQQVQSRPQAQAQPQRRQAQRQEKSRQAQAPKRPRAQRSQPQQRAQAPARQAQRAPSAKVQRVSQNSAPQRQRSKGSGERRQRGGQR